MIGILTRWVNKRKMQMGFELWKKQEETNIAMMKAFIPVAQRKIEDLEPQLKHGRNTLKECKRIVKEIRKHETAIRKFKQDIKRLESLIELEGEKVKYSLTH